MYHMIVESQVCAAAGVGRPSPGAESTAGCSIYAVSERMFAGCSI